VHQRLRSDRFDLLCDDRVTVPLRIDADGGRAEKFKIHPPRPGVKR